MGTRYWLLALGLGLGVLMAAPAADAPKADAEHIAKLVKQLGSDSFEDREKAAKELETLGTAALPALRTAAKADDAEVRMRAQAIIQKTERKAAAEKLLAATKVKLSFKDTPLAEAVAEFNKKSGYTIQVHDPEKKLKDRTVTLDTGDVSFWEAFDQFCDKAGLVEASMQDLLRAAPGLPGRGPGGGILPPPPPINPPKDLSIKQEGAAPAAEKPAEKKQADGAPARVGAAPAAPAAPVAMPGFGPFGMAPGVIMVMDGKPKAVPTCYSGSVRIRALKEGPNFGFGAPPVPPGGAPAAKDETTAVWLEVRAEPKLHVQFLESVAIEKATDDEGQKREKAEPPAPPVPGGLPGGAPPGGAIGAAIPLPMGFGGLGGNQYYKVALKKGQKEAKALKEFAGTITAQVVGPPEPVLTVDKITKAQGEAVKGKDGGQLKVTQVKEDDGKLTVTFELEMPRGVMAPNGGFGMPGLGPMRMPPIPAPLPPLRKPAPPGGAGLAFQAPQAPAAPPPATVAAPGAALFSAPGITLVDDKGKTIPQTGGAPPKFQFVPGQPPVMEYTQEYKLEKDQKPAKLVFSGSRAVILDIPFSLKDVPLK